MNPPRATDRDSIDFLVGTPRQASACEAARVQPASPRAPAHDAFSRLLARLEPDPETLWHEVRPHVRRANGILIVDDTVLDKPYARKMGLVGSFWSGKHKRVVRGIDLVTLAWSDGDAVYPVDYRLVDPAEAPKKNKNEHFREMLVTAKGRGLAPRYVCFDSWYSRKENLKAVRSHGWHFLTQVRSNRRVNLDRGGNKSIRDQPIGAAGTVVHVEGFGLVKAFRIVAPNGDTEHGVTNDLSMDDLTRVTHAQLAWNIEHAFRVAKSEIGLTHFEGRSYAGLMRHHVLCLVVFGFVASRAQALRGEKTGGHGGAGVPGAERGVR